jgi:dienelactone hydrolase
MPVTQTLAAGNQFLTSFNTTVPKLYITAETDDASEFDQVTLQQWREEGFEITYIPYGSGGKSYTNTLNSLSKAMGIGAKFGIVAFGDAAAACLEVFRRNTGSNRLCALVAYYPSSIPDPHSSFPMGIKVLVHLAGHSVGVTRNPEVLGIQGKRRTVTKTIPHGTGTGGSLRKLAYPSYTYEGAEPGFAEHDLEEYRRVEARLAWSRSLKTLRDAFGAEVDLERVWEDHVERKFSDSSPIDICPY